MILGDASVYVCTCMYIHTIHIFIYTHIHILFLYDLSIPYHPNGRYVPTCPFMFCGFPVTSGPQPWDSTSTVGHHRVTLKTWTPLSGWCRMRGTWVGNMYIYVTYHKLALQLMCGFLHGSELWNIFAKHNRMRVIVNRLAPSCYSSTMLVTLTPALSRRVLRPLHP